MDPYLESHWLDVNTSLVADARNALNQVLPDDLAASSQERVAIESDSDDQGDRNYGPDVRLIELVDSAALVGEPAIGAMPTAPIRLLAQVDPIIERFVKIVETGTERLITVLEFLSPINKRNPGLADFRSKRAELLTAGVNFVEIDLVRTGNWRALLRPHVCPAKWATPYRITVRTPGDPAAVGLHPVSLRQPLPSVILPLRSKDPEISLDLQTLITQAYANGRYSRRIDYKSPPQPPLSAEDQAWVSALVGG